MEQTDHNASAAEGELVRVVIAQRRPLDMEGLKRILQGFPGFTVVAEASRLEDVVEQCRQLEPDLLILDAKFNDRQIFRIAKKMLDQRLVRAVIFIDDDLSQMRLKRVSGKKWMGYFSRWASGEEIVAGARAALEGKFVFDSAFRLDPGWDAMVDSSPHFLKQSPFGELTTKQLDIVKLVAEGKTVKECAKILGISPSTVENHKCKVMKMLNVHRRTELTRLAMREGLVS
jgi:two-component system invasion response regulator UvrY